MGTDTISDTKHSEGAKVLGGESRSLRVSGIPREMTSGKVPEEGDQGHRHLREECSGPRK